MLGGRCDGGAWVSDYFEAQLYGGCRGCHFLEAPCAENGYSFQCQVLGGLDKLAYCPALQEYIDFHEIKLYGVRK